MAPPADSVRPAFTSRSPIPLVGRRECGTHSRRTGDTMRSRMLMAVAAGAALCAVPAVAMATPGDAGNRSFTMAVYGDAPYGTTPTDTTETEATPAFIDAVNADPDVGTVVHVGDIHSGKQYCTESYDRTIA